MRAWILGLIAATALSGTAMAQDVKPAIVYDIGGKFDKSFNEGVYNGAEQFKKETGVEYREFEIQTDAQREQALRRFARDGFSPDRRRRLRQATGAGEGRHGVPEHQVRDHRHGGRPAERAVDRLQGAGGLLPRRHAGGAWPPRPARSASSAAWTSR